MRYTIGHFAKMLGLTTDTVRQYEKSGIVTPYKDEKNGYRYFTPHDVRTVSICKQYRQMGFSLAEIAEILTSIPIDRLPVQFEKKREQLQQEMQRLQIQLDALRWHQVLLNDIPSQLDQFSICEMPAFIRLPHSDRDFFSLDGELTDLVREWIELLPLTIYSRRIPQAVLLGESPFTYDMGMMLQLQDVHRLTLPYADKVENIPAQRYLYTIIKKRDEVPFALEHLSPALDYISRFKLKISGDALGYFIASEVCEEGNYNYHAIYIPID